MTSVEKRRSGRKSGSHRKHSDGGYSDTSSSGSFLDETDREVSNLTDRAFRSLCIGDEAVYNDSDLCSSSPCSQRDKQLAFGQNREDREREELKRAAHESFRLRVQQYEQDWVHGGMSGAEICRDPHWEIHGEMTQGRVSATFQHSFVESAQQEQSLREDQLSFLSNGATELSSQQRRSRSRVSSLIRTFNSDSQSDGAWTDGKLRERYNGNSWDKTALMSIQRELSEFSNSYQQNFTQDNFPTADPFSSRNANLYSAQVAAVAHVNSAPSFTGTSHSMFNCNSNFFIHSEFSPFRVWRDHNRFPFQQEQFSGFSHHSEIPKWYETPMYKELSQEVQPQGSYRFKERGIGYSRNNLLPGVPPSPPRSSSTVLQKALAVEKRCESELMGQYTHRKRIQSLGTKRLPTQRPSTASPTSEMSRRVQETISSVKALQQKIKKMTEQNMATGMTANQQGALCSEEDLISYGHNAVTLPNVVRSNTTPLNISQLLTPSGQTHQEASVVQQCAASPEPVEHPPVRAESRGATPDIRMSGYRSRATSLLFNLKDNRKRVKNTYSPTKFKNAEMLEKNKQPSAQQPRDTVIDIPDFPDTDIQFTHAASHQYVQQYQNPGLSFATQNPCPKSAHAGQYSEYSLSDYQTAEKQAEMVCHSTFTGFTPDNYTATQLANGQNPHEDFQSLSSYQYGMTDNVESLRGGVCGLNASYTATDTPKHTVNNQTGDYFRSNANAEQYFNETVEREFTKGERYQQPKDNKHDYSNVFSQERWRNEQDTEKLISPWKQEKTALIERDQHSQAYQRAAIIKEEHNLSRDKYRGKNPNINTEVDKLDFEQSFVMGTSHKSTGSINPNVSKQLPQCPPIISNDAVENKTYYGQQQQPGTIRDKHVLQTYNGNNDKKETKDNSLTQNYNRHTDQDYRNQHALYSNKDKTMFVQETGQRKQYLPVPEGHRMQCLQQIQATPQFEHNVQKNPLSSLENAAATSMAAPVKDRPFSEVKAEQATTEHMKAQHTQAELAKAQHQAQVEQPKAESARLILAGQTGSEEVKAEQDRAEPSECERVRLRQAEPFKDKQRNEEQTEQSKEKHLEQARKEDTRVKQTRVQKGIEKPSDITEEAGAAHMKNEQGEQVNAEQAEVDKLKEEHIKTELEETEQARILTVHAKREKINVEKVEEKQLKVEQIEIEQKNAKQIRTEQIKAEQVEKEQRKDDKAKHEQIKEQKAKTEQLNMREAEVERVKVDQIKIEDIQAKPKEDSNQAGRQNTEQPTTQLRTTKEAKTEAQTHVEVAKPELPKTEDLYEKLVKAGPNIKVIQQVKGQPDRVEQVKTELAKAKAELAKIKDKMRGEQKGKVRNTIVTDDITKKDDPLKVNVNKNEDFKKKDQVTQMYQNKRESLDFKNDFTNAVSTNGNKSARGDDNETPTSCLAGAETVTKNKSNDKQSPKSGLATANTENKGEAISSKCNDLSESHYVYSESSKEFKLLSSSSSPTNVDNKGNCDTDKEKTGTVEKLEKCEAVKHTDISQPRNSDSRKHDPLERKHRSTDHSAVSSKDLHFTPPRALSQKERAQTKQEILTSKIKAHAEKEISAIRDGFLSKNSSKQLAGSQSINIRQRPLIQEVSKKHESTVSSNNKPKHQIEPPGIQLETVKSVSPASSAATPVMSAVTTGQLGDSSQKHVPKEPVKSNDNVLVSSRNTKQTGSSTTITNLAENQEKKNQSGVNSPLKSKEHAIDDHQAKQESNHEANAGKQKEERLKVDSVTSSDHRNEKKNDLSDATALVKVTPTKNPEIKHEAVPEDSAPTLNLVLQDQNTTPMVDDNLQIMGIMVIVRERKPLETNGERDNSARESMNTKKKEGSSGQASKANESSTEGNTAKTNNRVVQEMCPTEKEDQTEMNPPEIVPQTLSEIKNNESERVTEKKANLQESSSINTTYQRETQLQKPTTEKSVPATVTAPAKNKVLSETQPLLSKQRMIESSMNDPSNKMPKENSAKNTMKAEEEINSRKTQVAHTHDTFMAKVDNTGTDFKTNSGRTDAESSIKHDVQLSSTKDVMTCINPSKSWNIDGKSAPLLDEKTQDSTPPPHSLNENQNRCVTPKLQYKETFTEKKNQVDDVHIDSIAIRVVPSVTKEDKQDIAGKHCVTVVPSDVIKATELQEVAPPRHDERANTSNNDDRIKDLAPANSDRQVEDKLGVQHVLASVRKLSDSLKNSNTNGTQTGNGKPETVKERENLVVESKIKAMEGDYFQVQGAEETNDELHNSANGGETLDGVSKGGGLPGPLPNKTPVSNKPYKELQYEAFVLDPIIKKTLESSQIKGQDENMEKKNFATEDKLASKPTDTPTERQNSSEKMKNGKLQTVSQSSLSARESQSSRSSDQTRDNAISEKPGVKPKLKSSTIPEISAIADYARLKVIVSEEQESTIQEFPPKKEGFFPLIQSRHSRRPVFTLDQKEYAVKEKRMPNKPEMIAKVNKEPKALVFPITEKEHQRTGMFKLGDKEKQEKPETQGISDAGAKHTQCLKERMKSPTTLCKNQGREEQVARTDAQRQVDQSNPLSDNPDLQMIFSSAAVNRPRNTSASQHLMSPVNFNACEKHEQHKDDSRTPRKAEPLDDKWIKRREEREEKPSQEGLATQHDETTAKQSEKEEASLIEKEKRAEEILKKRIIEESRASQAEEERRSAQREEERRAKEREAIALRIKERREKQRDSDKRAEEDRKPKQMKENRAAPKEEEMSAKLREGERKVKETERTKTEEERRAKLRREEEQLKENEKKRLKQQEERAVQEEQLRRAALEKQKLAVQEEQQRRSAEEERQRRAAQEEQQRRAAQEEQQRRAAQEEKQKIAAQEEQQRRAAQEEQQRRAAQEEKQKRAAQEEKQKRAAREEQQQRAAQEDQRRRAAQEEQQRRAAQEEQQRKAGLERQQSTAQEQQRQALQEEHQRRVELEKQKMAAHEEQQRIAAQEEQQRRAAQEEQQRGVTHEEQQRRTAREEQQRRNAQEEQQRRAAQEEQQKRAEHEQQRRATQEEQQRGVTHEEQQRRAAREEQQRSDAQQELQIIAAQEQQRRATLAVQRKKDALIEERKQIEQTEDKILAEILEERKRAQGGGDRKAVEKEKTAAKQNVDKQAKEERTVQLEDINAEGESKVAREWLTQREDEIKATVSEEDEKCATQRKTERATQMEEQRKAAQMMDALQYYAINSTESERKTKERQVCSPFPSQQKHNPPECDSTEDSGTYTRHYRPHGSASPAPRSNTSSPALGAKPSMFRVKDNTIRGSSFTKPVKPRFHKNFGDDFRVGSPIERVAERGEEEQEIIRHGADTRSNRLAVIKEFSTSQPASSSQDYSAHQPQHRPYSRRSIALDEDDSRSIISNMSEGVESFATSATDLADVRSLYDYDRPESACSYSSDMSRSMGKPPTVPPKSDKAMQRAKRLTTRRINKELCKTKEDKHAGGEKPPQEVCRVPPSSSNEVHYSNRHAVASPHFSSPISLAHAPVNMPTSHTEHPSSHHPVQASPNAAGASSLPIASPHVTASVTLPVASSNPTSPASHNAVLKTVPHVSSSPTLHHATHPAPVTQYHVESSYPQSYPFTQRKVLQDLGSGQYFVVDVPVQVKTKTFFDPETGKYVQLNVRESGQSTSRPQPQQTYQQPQLQPQMRVKSQHPNSQASPAGKPIMMYQGYHGYPQGYQPTAINSVPPNGSSTPLSLHQNQQPVRENHSYGYPTSEVRENSEGHRYSPEKTPYMDTVNDTEKTYNTLYNTHGSYEAFPECDTNSQLAGSSVCENDNSAHTRYQPRDIITMGELEDFMEVSDW